MGKAIGGLAVIVIGGLLWFIFFSPAPQEQLAVGYVLYDPLIIQGESGNLTGISYDIAEAIAEELGIKLAWTTESTWPTALDDMNNGSFGAVGVQMWPDEGRRTKAVFTTSAMDSPVYAYGQAEDTRFSENLQTINQPGIRLAVVDTEIIAPIVSSEYQNVTVYSESNGTYQAMFQAVDTGTADVIFAEPVEAEAYIAANPNSLRRLSDEPVRIFANSFAFPTDQGEVVEQWNDVIEALIDDGTIASILARYNATDHYLLR